ncbi:Uncharacterised protein [Chlamydia trachomatis]|nr:Uncharacterised protein [Chlamydia trachomatis]
MSYYQTVINVLNNIDFPISFVKIPKSSNLEANYDFIKKTIEKDTQIDLDFRNEYFKNNLNDLGTLDITENIDSYCLVVKATSIAELKNNVSKIQSLFSNTPLRLNLLSKYSLINFLNFIFNVELDEKKIEKYLSFSQIKNKKEKFSLDEILSPKQVVLLKDKIKVDKIFLSFQTVNDFNTFQINEG